MKKLLATIISASLVVGAPAVFADTDYSVSVKTDYSLDITTVEGDFGVSMSDRRVNIVVLNPGYTAQDLGTAQAGVLNWSAQKELDSDGKFSVSMNLLPSETATDTVYTVLVAVDSASEVVERTFELYNDVYVNKVVGEIKDAVSDEDFSAVENIIEDYTIILDIGNTPEYAIYNSFTPAKKQRVCKGIVSENADSVESFAKAFAQSVCAVRLDDITDHKEYKGAVLSLAKDVADSVYAQLQDTSDKGDSELISALMEESFNCPSEIETKLYEVTVLKEINSSKIWTEIAAVYLKYADALGIDTDAYEKLEGKKSAMSNLIGEDFKSIEKAAQAFDEAVEEQEDKDDDNNSSGGSSGGGGGGGGRGSVSIGGASTAPVQPIVPGSQPPVNNDKSFSDLAGFDWAKESIDALSSKGIINGYSDNTFAPGKSITRAEFVKIFVSAFGIKAGDKTMAFDDVNTDDWYYECINTAYSAGYINGVSAESFAPDANITREDIAVILFRYLGSDAQNGVSFADSDKISDYAKNAVSALSSSKILNGYEDNTFRPDANATRAEVATVISRILNKKGE